MSEIEIYLGLVQLNSMRLTEASAKLKDFLTKRRAYLMENSLSDRKYTRTPFDEEIADLKRLVNYISKNLRKDSVQLEKLMRPYCWEDNF